MNIIEYGPVTERFKYRGPNQRKTEKTIVLGMACPQCKGPVHDPSLSQREIKRIGGLPEGCHVHLRYACYNACGWSGSIRVTARNAGMTSGQRR